MRARTALILFCLGFMVVAVEAQVNAWYQWTFLDSALMDEIIGEERWHLANWARFKREHFEIGDRP